MRLKLFFAVFLSIVFIILGSINSFAVYPPVQTPPSNSIIDASNSQIIVVYRANQSPQQLQMALAAKQKASSSIGGKINMFFSELLGKTPGNSFYTSQLNAINQVQKKAKVISEKNLYPVKANNPVTVIVLLQKGASTQDAIKLYLSLPQVQTASPNAPSTIQSIQSTGESDPYEIAKHQIIVQYKEGTTPDDVANAIEQRAKVASQPVFGQARIAAEDAINALQGGTTPGQLQEQYAETKEKNGVISSDPLITESKRPTSLENVEVVKLQDSTSLNSAIDSFKSLPTVEYAVPNSVVLPVDTPNDPLYSQEWGLTKIQAPQAWDIAKGSDSVIVAVVDSGADYNHPDLVGHIVKGQNFVPGENANDPSDQCGHGTHVSGTIGAMTNNSLGIAGVNWNVKVMAIKVFSGACQGNLAPIISGIHYAADHGAKVINMSLGAYGACGPYQEAVDYARSAGVSVIVAAGNGNPPGVPVDASTANPANCLGVIVVGASTESDARASFSNYGSTVTIAAPGVNIMSTMTPGNTMSQQSNGPKQCLNQSYCLLGGTSMATPHVAGAAGILLSINPSLTPDQIKNTLMSTADPISTDKPIGARLNLLKAVQAVSGSVTPPAGNPTATPTPTTGPGTPTPTSIPGNPTATPTPTTVPGNPTATPTPTPTPGVSGSFKISVNLLGIGPGGNTNPTPSSKDATVEFVNKDGNSVAKKNVSLSYRNNAFEGTVSINDVAPGIYQIRVSLPGTLARFVKGIYTLGPNTGTITLPTVTPTTGDVNRDRVLDILDYNILVSNIQNNSFDQLSDLNSDGLVNSADLNIFLRQLGSRTGD